MNDTNWVNSHYSFFKNNPFLIIYLYGNIKKKCYKNFRNRKFSISYFCCIFESE